MPFYCFAGDGSEKCQLDQTTNQQDGFLHSFSKKNDITKLERSPTTFNVLCLGVADVGCRKQKMGNTMV